MAHESRLMCTVERLRTYRPKSGFNRCDGRKVLVLFEAGERLSDDDGIRAGVKAFKTKNPSVATCSNNRKKRLNFRTQLPQALTKFPLDAIIRARCKQRAGVQVYFINSFCMIARLWPASDSFVFSNIDC